MSNYGTKSNLKNAAGVGASEFPKKGNLADLKSDIDKTDIRKLQTTLVGLITLSNLMKNEVIKNTLYDKFFKNVKSIKATDTSNIVNKLTKTKKLTKLKRKYMIVISINVILLLDLIG